MNRWWQVITGIDF